MMLLSSVLSSALQPPPKSPTDFPSNRLPISKFPILISGLPSKRLLVDRMRVSGPRDMAELARFDAFRGGDAVERDREGEALLGDGPVGLRRNAGWDEVESIINKMSKWLVAGLFGLVILWKHDAVALWAAMGSVVNSWLSITLKQILNHQRPVSASRNDPGMPSSHAQSIFFAAIYAVLSLVNWMGLNTFTVTVGTFILISGSYLSWLRISQKLHTVSQVLVGVVLGSTCAITWFWLWHSVVLGAFLTSVWVRIVMVLGSVTFCMTFLIYVIQHWVMDDH